MSVPYYASEKCFRIYEHVIAQLVNNWPAVVRFSSERSASTDKARLRDSINSCKKNQWPSSMFGHDLFSAVAEQVCVWTEDGPGGKELICVGPAMARNIGRAPTRVDNTKLDVPVLSPPRPVTQLVARPQTFEQIEILASLVDQGVIPGHIEVVPDDFEFEPTTLVAQLKGIFADALNVEFVATPRSVVII